MHSRTHPSHHTVHDDQNYRDTISVDKFDQKKKNRLHNDNIISMKTSYTDNKKICVRCLSKISNISNTKKTTILLTKTQETYQ